VSIAESTKIVETVDLKKPEFRLIDDGIIDYDAKDSIAKNPNYQMVQEKSKLPSNN